MAVVFTAREILEAAVEKEGKRKNFYAQVAELSTNPATKELFAWLVEEEERHVATFSDLRDGQPIVDARPEEYIAEMDTYMDSVIDQKLYSQVDSKEFVQRAINAKEVFKLAIGFEKDAILYFREFLPQMSKADQQIVMALIDQEKGHIRRLVEAREQLGEG